MNMKYQITEKQKEEIEQTRRKNKNKQIERRLKVLSLKAEGASYKEIIAATGYSKANVAKIVKLYFEKGLEEICSNQENDIILVAVSGKIGLRPTLKAIENRIDIACLNSIYHLMQTY